MDSKRFLKKLLIHILKLANTSSYTLARYQDECYTNFKDGGSEGGYDLLLSVNIGQYMSPIAL